MSLRSLLSTPLRVFAMTCMLASHVLAVDYLSDIKPILAEKCYSCHGRIKQEADLRLDTRSLMINGGAIEPGKPDSSVMLQRVMATDDSRMPPHNDGSALKSEELQLLRDWIRGGAVAPDEPIPSGPSEHWAFQEIRRPELPKPALSQNPIDALLSAKRQGLSLTPVRRAPQSILLRRLYLDLIGLPPTAKQLQDDRPWQTIVDELLNSSQHGERWARHWMDVWRYSDWYGLNKQLRYSQKHLWHWRDWIIESLNTDKGYDRMIQEMLAGDELAPKDPDVIRATGFLARNYYLFNRTTWLDSTIEHTSKAFFGLTVNCAKCHDHKYDPITQMDYYRMRAVFEPHQIRLDPLPGVTNFDSNALPRAFDDHTDEATHLHVRGDEKNPDMETKVEPGVPSFLASFQPTIEPVLLPFESYAPGAREYVQKDRLRAAQAKVSAAKRQVQAAQENIASAKKRDAAPKKKPTETFLLVEDFTELAPDVWKLIGNGWQFRDGALHQTTASRDKQMARLLKQPPADFDLTCHYTTTGGATYKSVTFRFDQSEDGKHSSYVYTSAHAPAPKVQIALTRNGKTTYPAEGRKRHAIKVGQKHKLRFAVRGTLVNVWLDDAFIVAYRLPDRRPTGFLSLSGFDATVAFDQLTIRSLDDDVQLTDAKNKAIPSVTDAELALRIVKAKLAVAEALLRSVQTTIDADNGKYRDKLPTKELQTLADAAAMRQAEHQLAEAELLALTEPAKSKNAIAKANQRLAEIKKGDISYQSIRGARKALETPAHKEADYPATYAATSTGRRLSLARWATSSRNPLTARVAVNHIWMRHFGEPLVESVFDFGLRSPQPIHADILDYLASEFIQSGWSMRHLHRLIVTSDTYQLSSQIQDRDYEVDSDSDNRYYWRANTRRMEAQVVRDSLLLLAGTLDTTIGGPSVDANSKTKRRSVYFKHSRDDRDLFLKMFDDADLLQCYRRSESVVPQQALALANSELAISAAQKIASDIAATNADQNSFIDATFDLLLARDASVDEIRVCHDFFDQMNTLLQGVPSKDSVALARTRFVQAILNHNDFVSIR